MYTEWTTEYKSESVDMSYSSVILTETKKIMTSTLKAAIIKYWPLEGRRTPKRAVRQRALLTAYKVGEHG